jgi:hypothetical protein
MVLLTTTPTRAAIHAILENPPSLQTVGGNSTIAGWTFSTLPATPVTVILRVDGVTTDTQIPCCDPRPDVVTALGPDTPLNTGFSLPFNYGLLSAGPHIIGVELSAPGEATQFIDHSVTVVTVGQEDTDGDGIVDALDNCPTVPNPDQADRDRDLIGDVCDPFPDDSDNEQAQCEADLAQCLVGVAPDQDGDGEADTTDACPNTPEGAEVDQAGCSLAQFCAAVDATTAQGAKVCKNSDWRNDNPLAASNKGDCKVKKGNPGRADDLCVPRL